MVQILKPSKRRTTKALKDVGQRLEPLPLEGHLPLKDPFPFNRLPVELRLRVWQFTAEPRHIMIWQPKPLHEYFYFRYTSFPVALHVCTESRSGVLPQYTRILLSPEGRHYEIRRNPRVDYFNGGKKCNIYSYNGRKHYVNYINFALDTVVFPCDFNHFHTPKALSENFKLIQSIVIGTDLYDKISSNTISTLRELPSLKAIHILVSGHPETGSIYDPSVRYKLSMTGAPQGYGWESLLASYRRLIAEDWKGDPPLKGLVAIQKPSSYSEPADELCCGEYRDWMGQPTSG